MGSVFEIACALAGNEFAANAGARDEKLGAETASLGARLLGQIRARNTLGEPEVIFDFGSAAGLAADGGAFDDNRGEAFGSPINGCAQASGTGAVDR